MSAIDMKRYNLLSLLILATDYNKIMEGSECIPDIGLPVQIALTSCFVWALATGKKIYHFQPKLHEAVGADCIIGSNTLQIYMFQSLIIEAILSRFVRFNSNFWGALEIIVFTILFLVITVFVIRITTNWKIVSLFLWGK